MIVLRECADWRRAFVREGIPVSIFGRNANILDRGPDEIRPLIAYDDGERRLFVWGGGSLLEVYTVCDRGLLAPLSCRQVAGRGARTPGELAPAGGSWPTEDEIVEAIKRWGQP